MSENFIPFQLKALSVKMQNKHPVLSVIYTLVEVCFRFFLGIDFDRQKDIGNCVKK